MIATEREANQCSVTVTDRGPGIDNPVRCLERFESTKQGHLGLGLCMARRIASIGATMNAQTCPGAPLPLKKATPSDRAGLTDVLSMGMEMR